EVDVTDAVHLEIDETRTDDRRAEVDGSVERRLAGRLAVVHGSDAVAVDDDAAGRASGAEHPVDRSGHRNAHRRRASPTMVRGTRRAIDVRAGRSSCTATGISVVARPARSTRRMSSVSNRSRPSIDARASGSTIARRNTFMPCVSETRSPKPARRIVENTAV